MRSRVRRFCHPYDEAVQRDQRLLEAVARGDIGDAEQGEACGLPALLCLMQIAEHLHWQASVLAYANSGDTCSSRQEVVGYGAVAFMLAVDKQRAPASSNLLSIRHPWAQQSGGGCR